MFGLTTLQTLGAALVAAFLLAGGGYTWGRVDAGKLTDAAVAEALEKARNETYAAINELGGAADDARVRRRVCLSTGGVWDFGRSECGKASTQP